MGGKRLQMSILVDINGTIVSEGKPIWPMIDYIKSLSDDIYLISGSSIKKKNYYETLMKRIGISYIEIILNPLNENTDLTFKGRIANTIPNLTLAIDNNKNILSMYNSMGINAVHPGDLCIMP